MPVTFPDGEATPAEDWRIVATWNGATPPRAAILRRFALITVHPPADDELHAAIKHAAGQDATATAAAEKLVHYQDRVGTGVLLEAAKHAAARQAADAHRPRHARPELDRRLHRAADRALTVRRTPQERAALRRAKATLDQLDFYPKPVDIRHVRILHVPWLFRLPWFRRFHGYEMGPLILIKRPLARVPAGPDRARAVPRVAGPGPSTPYVVELPARRLRQQPARDRGAPSRRRGRVTPMDECHAHRDRHRPGLPAGLARPARGADPRPPDGEEPR